MTRLPTLALLGLFPLAVAAAPVPKVLKKKTVPSLEGTTWVGEHVGASLGQVVYTFGADGKYTSKKQGGNYGDGSWKQDGDRLYFEANNRFAEYTLTFQDGQFAGDAKNVRGKTWTITLTRQDEK